MAFFIVFQLLFLKLPARRLLSCWWIGLHRRGPGAVFDRGQRGLHAAGNYIGQVLGSLEFNWILIPIGMIIGYYIVSAEPAVHVLNTQVEEMTDGAITRRAMMYTLSIGMAFSVGLAMTRVITGISIWYLLVPGYALALGLSFFVPPVFTAVAFDSGGVASGPMTATFLLPLAMGACQAVGGNILTDAFGIVAHGGHDPADRGSDHGPGVHHPPEAAACGDRSAHRRGQRDYRALKKGETP